MPIVAPVQSVNRLISKLSAKERYQFIDGCEVVDMHFGDWLYHADSVLTHVYFPLTGFISMVKVLENYPTLEVGLIGNEGMFGVSMALGINAMPLSAIIQGDGTALRMTVELFEQKLLASPRLQRTLNRYLYLSVTELAQATSCIHSHEIEPRLARWLLMTQDRAHADHFHLTHTFLAGMLGVRRSGVTIAAGALQQLGIIEYTRGEISILDRQGLEAMACSCYSKMRDNYSRWFE